MSVVEETIDVAVPVRTAYDQWTQFEEFPEFMQGVKSVNQTDDTHLEWHAEIAGREKHWRAEILEQEPDSVISWRSLDGAQNDGSVRFESVGSDAARITLRIEADPEGLIENIGDRLGFLDRQVRGDLGRFKEYIESRGSETGAWRGEVQDGEVSEGATGTATSTASTSTQGEPMTGWTSSMEDDASATELGEGSMAGSARSTSSASSPTNWGGEGDTDAEADTAGTRFGDLHSGESLDETAQTGLGDLQDQERSGSV